MVAKSASDVTIPTELCKIVNTFLLVSKVFGKFGEILKFHVSVVVLTIQKYRNYLG